MIIGTRQEMQARDAKRTRGIRMGESWVAMGERDELGNILCAARRMMGTIWPSSMKKMRLFCPMNVNGRRLNRWEIDRMESAPMIAQGKKHHQTGTAGMAMFGVGNKDEAYNVSGNKRGRR